MVIFVTGLVWRPLSNDGGVQGNVDGAQLLQKCWLSHRDQNRPAEQLVASQ